MTRTPWIVAALVAATLIAYLPALSSGFVWDDNDWVTEHPVVTGEQGWSEIWTGQTRFQFYPVLFSAWRIQHALWGLNPVGYHAVNILLHAATAVLLGLFFTRLGLRGAWWIAAAFALHPVHVESVAWVTELKNVLSGALVVGSALLFLTATQGKTVARGRYALALVLFVAAMLAKTAVAAAAVLLPIVLYLKRDRFETRHLTLAAPFVAVGVVLRWIAVRLEQGRAAAMGADFAFTWLDRVLIGTHALFFYPMNCSSHACQTARSQRGSGRSLPWRRSRSRSCSGAGGIAGPSWRSPATRCSSRPRSACSMSTRSAIPSSPTTSSISRASR